MRDTVDGLPSRRQFLGAVGSAVGVGLAGCLGNAKEAGEQAPGQPLDAPRMGEQDADVTVVAYEDFGCGHCATFDQAVKPEIEATYFEETSPSVAFEFRDYVIPADGANSWEAASAARAVQDRGGDAAFWEFTAHLFANQDSLGGDLYEQKADELGVDGQAVRQAASEQAYTETVEHFKTLGEEDGIEGTPTVVVNCEIVDWGSAISFQPVQETVTTALEDGLEC
jgi:protein-disulfide isomerase